MLVFLPHGSAQSRVNELRASARTRFELEAVAIQKYERDVVGYRAYLQMPRYDHDAITGPPETVEPRRSLA